MRHIYFPAYVLLISCGSPEQIPQKIFGDSCIDTRTGDSNDSEEPSQDPLRFAKNRVEATLTAYERHQHSPLKEFQFALAGDTTLTSEDFTTYTKPVSRVTNENHIFSAEESSYEFQEISVFAHASHFMTYFENLGFDKRGEQVQIILHQTIKGNRNNAQYAPITERNPTPKIYIGSGDGEILQNLPLDADVVYHELSHHIIYRHLADKSATSLLVHEGLSDAFTTLKNDDPCLGSTICPLTSSVCQTSACLRTAENDFVMSEMEEQPIHKQSQVVSGLVWDLREIFSNEELFLFVYETVKLLPNVMSSTNELVNAMLQVDAEHFNNRAGGLILSLSAAREL